MLRFQMLDLIFYRQLFDLSGLSNPMTEYDLPINPDHANKSWEAAIALSNNQ